MADTGIASLALLALAMGAAGAVTGIALGWRDPAASSERLPLWAFLGLQGISRDAAALRLGKRAMHLAEMRCAACGTLEECRRRLAAGKRSPVSDCPNADLFGRARAR